MKQAVSAHTALSTSQMGPTTSQLASTRHLLSVRVTRKMGPLERAYTPARAPSLYFQNFVESYLRLRVSKHSQSYAHFL